MIGLILKKTVAEKGQITIPGFGSFTGSYVSAELQFADKAVSPAGLKIRFETTESATGPNLHEILCQDFGLNPSQCTYIVESWVKQAWQSLEVSHRFEISGFGLLKPDVEGQIQFHPKPEENYQTESYGLPILRAEMLASKKRKEQDWETPVIPLHPFDNESRADRSQSKQRFGFRRMSIAAIVLALLASFATVFYLSNQAIKNSQELASQGKEIRAQKAEIVPSIAEEKSTKIETPTLAENAAKPAETVHAPSPSKPVSNTENEVRFYVIAGSFRMEDKSRSRKQTLSESGYSTALLYSKEKELTRVSIGGFGTKAEALNFLTETQPKFEDQLWVLAE